MTACNACPFRIGSKTVYDADAMESLNDGFTPSCHKAVGTQRIFCDPFPSATRCRGYDAWTDGVDGFAVPKQVATNETRIE